MGYTRKLYFILPLMVFFLMISFGGCRGGRAGDEVLNLADKPLFRDTIYDGAADPVLVWNEAERKWLMFYTNRRANMHSVNGVDWVHGTPIGIAESVDGGATWSYLCDANILYGEEDYTFCAPDIIEHDGRYHMYLTVVPGTFTDWNHPRDIVHLISMNLIDWHFESVLNLASDKVIDAGIARNPDGTWYLYYNNEKDSKSIYYAVSGDLYSWEDKGKLQGDFPPGEGPKVFFWNGKYFLVVDEWKGFGVYSSDDMVKWERQYERLLSAPGTGADDGVIGNHADVVVAGDRAYIFYFTHPGHAGNEQGYGSRRSSIQVAELEYIDGILTCDRDKPVYINLNLIN
ncbi:MAG: family 43 glycosylhydrolase [Rikenellaceae bacterium]|nr:family 43 glycosylhydrolase [Rikenellaceae bacterium]